MFHGKMKALTFSYDDGVTQDRRLVELFDRYGLKATFNINSELLGKMCIRDRIWPKPVVKFLMHFYRKAYEEYE